MDCSTPGLPHHSPEFAQVHVHCIGNAIQPSHPLLPLPSIFPSIRDFSKEVRVNVLVQAAQAAGLRVAARDTDRWAGRRVSRAAVLPRPRARSVFLLEGRRLRAWLVNPHLRFT